MKASTHPALDALAASFAECLNPESARRLLRLKADRRLQKRVGQLAEKCSAGTLTAEERSEYESYVRFGTFIALVKSKARQRLERAAGA